MEMSDRSWKYGSEVWLGGQGRRNPRAAVAFCGYTFLVIMCIVVVLKGIIMGEFLMERVERDQKEMEFVYSFHKYMRDPCVFDIG